MISFISGTLADYTVDSVVIECSGVGFCINVPQTVIERLPARQSPCKLYTYLSVKEDSLSLYGFITRQEQEMFEKLIGVSGIGPKGALGILSYLSIDTLRFAIFAQDAKTIAKAPGIGLKTAQKLILELKDKLPADKALQAGSDEIAEDGSTGTSRSEAAQALEALGYSAAEAYKAVAAVKGEDLDTEALIKAALKQMVR